MDAERWDRIQKLFEAALDHSTAERPAFLREACAGDAELYQEVVSLLEEDRHTHSLLDGVALDAAGLLDDLSLEGQQVGSYLLLHPLGQGGMGAVYLAERADGQFEQQVALKLIKRGMDSEQILRRFRSERQILARLHHPHIARLLDGGITEAGQPYFVMEYVEGEPITDYCDTRQLTVDARLGLFEQVCKAVMYAHGQLVVHRDLKPSNILVTEGNDGSAQVKLLDFGIAKLLTEEGQGTALTQTGHAVMTPAYASPEQVRGEAVSTAADIYSLGVVLYELLAGVRPYAVESRSPVEVLRVVSEEEPDRPSTAVSRAATGADTTTATTISRSRGTEPGRLRRRLAGDLDVICLKALRKEPVRRYGSVEALAEDLRRHLSGLPVLARPDAVGYRLRKFIGRHRRGMAAAVVVVILIAGLVGFYTQRLRQERNRAQLEAEKAEQVAAFLQGLFEVSIPGESEGREVTARELLSQGAARVEEELADQPEVQAQMMQVIGDVYSSLGLYPEADTMTQKALERWQALYGDRHVEVAESKMILARIRLERGDLAAAESLHTEAVATQRALLEPDDPERAKSLSELAWLRQRQGDTEAAIALNREALDLRRKAYGDEHPLVTISLNNLANALHAHGSTEEAEPLYRQALAMQQREFGPEHPEVANTMNNLALMLNGRGAYAAAESLYRQVLAIDLKTLGPEHPYVAISKNNLAQALQHVGRYPEADSLFAASLALRRQLFGDEHPAVAESYHNAAVSLMEQDRYADAEPLLRRAHAINQKTLGPEHPRTAISLNALAYMVKANGDTTEAERLFRDAIRLHEASFPEGHMQRANPLFGLGELLAERGRYEEAEPLLEEALAIRRQALDAGHRDIANAARALAGCWIAAGRFEEAEPLLLDAYAALRDASGDQNKTTQKALRQLVALYEQWGKPQEAETYAVRLRG